MESAQFNIKSNENYRETMLKCMDWCIDNFKPKSMVDFNCNYGVFIESAVYKRVGRIKGYESDIAYRDTTLVEFASLIEYIDSQFYINVEKYDLVVCLDKSQHVSKKTSLGFVNNLYKALEHKGIILFTVPDAKIEKEDNFDTALNDGLTRNEWVNLFASFGLQVDIKLTSSISFYWNTFNCPANISDNILVFKK